MTQYTPETCPEREYHGRPFRYCGSCSWAEETPGPVPTPGRVVLYTLSEYDAEAVNRRRADAAEHMREHQAQATGVQLHVGNDVREGDVYPMVIVHAWGDQPGSAVNGQVLLDGNDTYWATSRTVGEGPGFFAWPKKA